MIRRSVLLTLMAFLAGSVQIAWAQDATIATRFFRIATGGVAGTYYPIGGLIADAISHPVGARPCSKGGSCGVPGMVAVAQSSNGSVANIEAIITGEVESGFAQSDIAHWAFEGSGIFEGSPPAQDLRAIASLYPESVHLVAAPDSGIATVADLKGKRVSLDEPGSGTLVDARIILEAFGLSEADIDARYIKPSPALSAMIDGELDAFFIVAGYPTASVEELAYEIGARLVPIDGPNAEALVEHYPFFSQDIIPAGTYEGIGATPTLSVGAQWLCSADLDETLVYELTRALWHPRARPLLDLGHDRGADITIETALDGIAIPLHPGAERYYREVGLIQ